MWQEIFDTVHEILEKLHEEIMLFIGKPKGSSKMISNEEAS